MIFSEMSASFMHSVFSNVWGRLEEDGRKYNFGQVMNRFKAMMDDPKIKKEVENVFFDSFEEKNGD